MLRIILPKYFIRSYQKKIIPFSARRLRKEQK
jgi:hypothetical protein